MEPQRGLEPLPADYKSVRYIAPQGHKLSLDQKKAP